MFLITEIESLVLMRLTIFFLSGRKGKTLIIFKLKDFLPYNKREQNMVTVKYLKQVAKRNNIKNYSRIQKQELSDLIWANISIDERKKEMDLMRKLNQEEREQKQKQNLKHLKQLTKSRGFRGYSKLNKDELIKS